MKNAMPRFVPLQPVTEWKPVVDELQLHDFSVILLESYTAQTVLEFIAVCGSETHTIQGFVDRIDSAANRFRIAWNGSYEWIRLADLIDIEPVRQLRYS